MNYLFIDEVGYGALAGPVVVCGVVSPKITFGCWDSKTLTSAQRKKIFAQNISCISFLQWISAPIIDAVGIRHATNNAISKIVSCASQYNINKVYIDGIIGPKLDIPHDFVKQGDAIIKEIGLSSIIAKVNRDTLMQELSNLHPEYGWIKNVGYGTKAHIEAIRAYGLTDYHRKSYRIS